MQRTAVAAFMADGAADPHIRFNMVFCRAPQVARYPRDRLKALAGAREAVTRMSTSGTRAT